MRSRGRVRVLVASLVLAAGATSCALDNDTFVAPDEPRTMRNLPRRISYEYSRNGIVCVPTMVGNGIGGVAGIPLATACWGLSMPLMIRDREQPRRIAESCAWVPILAGGALTGTPFLPFSYLTKESRCGIH